MCCVGGSTHIEAYRWNHAAGDYPLRIDLLTVKQAQLCGFVRKRALANALLYQFCDPVVLGTSTFGYRCHPTVIFWSITTGTPIQGAVARSDPGGRFRRPTQRRRARPQLSAHGVRSGHRPRRHCRAPAAGPRGSRGASAVRSVTFSYVPGLLLFREAPIALAALGQ